MDTPCWSRLRGPSNEQSSRFSLKQIVTRKETKTRREEEDLISRETPFSFLLLGIWLAGVTNTKNTPLLKASLVSPSMSPYPSVQKKPNYTQSSIIVASRRSLEQCIHSKNSHWPIAHPLCSFAHSHSATTPAFVVTFGLDVIFNLKFHLTLLPKATAWLPDNKINERLTSHA